MSRRVALPTFVAAILSLAGSGPAAAAIFTVTTNADSGAGSLRAAITAANSAAGVDEIRFNLPEGQRVITPLTPLPVMTTPIDVNGTSQPGWAGIPLVSLNGTTSGGTGLRSTATFSAVRGLAIYGFATGVRMESTFAVVKSNYLGLTAAGAGGSGNTGDGLVIDGTFATVGGTQPIDRNVISGNGGNGMSIGAAATDALIYGNYFGTNDVGTGAIGNGGYAIRSFGADNQIGTNLVGGGNLISGNERGISLESDSDTGTSVRGNVIGLNSTGTAKIPNDGSGIEVYSDNNTIGGTFAGDRNVISGNNGAGIVIGEGHTGNLIEANYIGVSPSGTTAFGNTSIGIVVSGDDNTIGGTLAAAANVISGNAGGVDLNGGDNNVLGNIIGLNAAGTAALGNTGAGVGIYGGLNEVGGATPGAGNVISGNGQGGITVVGGDGSKIEGNLIGLNKAGTAAVGNGSYAVRVLSTTGLIVGSANAGNVMSGNARGVVFESDAPGNLLQGNIIGLAADGQAAMGNQGNGVELNSGGNTVGGSDPGTGNIISSNQYYGVVFQGETSSGNLVQGNLIGVASDATTLRGNYYNVLSYGASGNTIGGTGEGEGNVIAGSVNAGVYVWFGTHYEILGNSFFSNGGQAIDLDPQGVQPNDKLDADTGSNERQNMPILTSAIATPGQLSIDGVLASYPSSEYRVEFFVSPSCDPSGFGEGKTFLGAATVVTDSNGSAVIDATLPYVFADTIVTATATSPDGDTSEFSPCITVGEGANPGTIQFSQGQYLGYEEVGSVEIFVVRTGGASGEVTVDYTTVEDTATSPEDFLETSGTLTFADGEVVKSFTIPLVLDAPDGSQNIELELNNTTGGANLGAQATSHVLLFDYSTAFPGVFISDAYVYEGDDGTTNMDFEVTLTPTDHQVTVTVHTMPGTATAADFTPLESVLVFEPGEGPKTVSVSILGDTDVEGTEAFFLLVSQALPGGYAGNIGHGYIMDDEGDIAVAECGNGLVQDPETCDDKDTTYAAGDYCSAACVRFPCGIPTKVDGVTPKTSDAYFVLRAAVSDRNCDVEVCDVNDSGTITATDALLILQKAVGLNVDLTCPE